MAFAVVSDIKQFSGGVFQIYLTSDEKKYLATFRCSDASVEVFSSISEVVKESLEQVKGLDETVNRL